MAVGRRGGAKPTKTDRPHIPKPSEEAVRKGAPSSRASYIKDGVPIYQHRPGLNRVRFLAWKDGAHFFYYLYIHTNIGFNEDSWACLTKNWNKSDPICEDAQRQLNEEGVKWEEVLAQGILPQKNPRILAQIVDRQNEEAGVQIWNVSSFKVDGAIRSLSVHEDTGAIIPWTDPEDGCDLIYDYDSKAQYPMPENLRRSDPKALNVEFYRHIMDFEKDVIYIPTYKEMEKSYYGDTPPEGYQEEPPEEDVPDFEPPTQEEEKKKESTQSEGGSSSGGDPLADAGIQDCFKMAYTFYEDCKDCADEEKCKESRKWTGESCPECGLPVFEEGNEIKCSLGHVKEVKEKEEPAPRRRRPVSK